MATMAFRFGYREQGAELVLLLGQHGVNLPFTQRTVTIGFVRQEFPVQAGQYPCRQ